jgi:hypothetical protein
MTVRRTLVLLAIVACAALYVCVAATEERPAPVIAVYFSPHGGCTDAIVKQLDAAKKTVLVRAIGDLKRAA